MSELALGESTRLVDASLRGYGYMCEDGFRSGALFSSAEKAAAYVSDMAERHGKVVVIRYTDVIEQVAS